MTNKNNTTFYIGTTVPLKKRIWQHKEKKIEGFTKKYNLTKFVYYEEHPSSIQAIEREKQLKNWKRDWKISLIKEFNPTFKDMYEDI